MAAVTVVDSGKRSVNFRTSLLLDPCRLRWESGHNTAIFLVRLFSLPRGRRDAHPEIAIAEAKVLAKPIRPDQRADAQAVTGVVALQAGRQQQPKGKSNKEKRLEFDATSQSNMEQVNGRGTSFDREGDRRPPSFEFGERPRGKKK